MMQKTIGHSALSIAAAHNEFTIVDRLLQTGCEQDVNASGLQVSLHDAQCPKDNTMTDALCNMVAGCGQ